MNPRLWEKCDSNHKFESKINGFEFCPDFERENELRVEENYWSKFSSSFSYFIAAFNLLARETGTQVVPL